MDIDIDIPEKQSRSDIFKYAIKASMVKDEKLVPHPCGMYLQNMPMDPITGLAAIPYDAAEELGYTKIDFLHLNILNQFENKDQINQLLEKEPKWSLLSDITIVNQLFQINNHFDVVSQVRPRSTTDLADCIALIRPGKRELLDMYLNPETKQQARTHLYTISARDKYAYKKGHAIAYAMIIVLQLHLLGYTNVIE